MMHGSNLPNVRLTHKVAKISTACRTFQIESLCSHTFGARSLATFNMLMFIGFESEAVISGELLAGMES